MRKILLLGLAIVFITSCESNMKQRYTQQSPEIETYKQVIDAYENQDWDALTSHYADTAKIMYNKQEKDGMTKKQLLKMHKEDAEAFNSWEFLNGESEYEMVVTDRGETWVNFWGIWKGDFKPTQKTYTIPAHYTARFVDGKIVKEFGYWDLSALLMDLQQIEQQKELAKNKESDLEAQ
ncbi:ester cyclase [Marixanthomonas spongiae]|uniref:Nuclear transport factor 2 family protein n=1 Tax=Marixanthomonas spongiae TaxID=2174845 RepID=A0A2U0I613_9FLAO|nr:ester cyclase [Marixanthomonas spongiae]PVW16504.1 nuclear transport factor 2 family protein [Marixanthomonas spongiae]